MPKSKRPKAMTKKPKRAAVPSRSAAKAKAKAKRQVKVAADEGE